MSLTDPVAVRREKEAREQAKGWTPYAVQLFVAMIALFLAGGWATGRSISAPIDDPGAQLWWLPLGIGSDVVGLLMWATWITICLRRGLPGTIGIALSIVALGLGLQISVEQSWPIYVWGGGVALMGLGVLARMRRAAVRRQVAATQATGWETTGTLTDLKGPDLQESQGSQGVLTVATFTFRDLAGVQRWVQRPMLIRRGEDFPIGTTTRIWLPARGIGDAGKSDTGAKIVVELSEEHSMKNAW